jgi:hypothetical protein
MKTNYPTTSMTTNYPTIVGLGPKEGKKMLPSKGFDREICALPHGIS